MTKSALLQLPKPRVTWRRRLFQGLGLVALLSALPLCLEIGRWHALPPGDPPFMEMGPAAGTEAGNLSRQALAAWLETRTVAGIEACVGIRGAVAWCSASGYADLGEERTLEPTTSARLGSVAKPITSILLARLEERGVVDLDRAIGEVFPEIPAHLKGLTLRQLAAHTSGIRHYRWRIAWPPHETWSRRRYESVSDSLSQFLDDPLAFAPGSSFRYSSHGYTLLGAVLERATGTSFGELLRQELVVANDLQATELDSVHSERAGARSYEVIGDWYRNAPRVDNSRGWPGAGIRSSASDLVRLVSALPEGKLLSHETFDRYLTPQRFNNGDSNPEGYSLGWRIAHTRKYLGGSQSFRVAHHGGVGAGASAYLILFPDQSLAATVITNSRTGSAALADLAFEIAAPFLSELVTNGGTLAEPAPP